MFVNIYICFQFLPSSNDTVLVSGAADSKIKVHDIVAKETTHTISCHKGRVKRIATTNKEPCMFWSAAEDGCVMYVQCAICWDFIINFWFKFQ